MKGKTVDTSRSFCIPFDGGKKHRWWCNPPHQNMINQRFCQFFKIDMTSYDRRAVCTHCTNDCECTNEEARLAYAMEEV